MRKNKIIITVLSFIVLLTVIYGFMDGGSPQDARKKRYDDKRTLDIQMIKSWINAYYNKNNLLPPSILDASTDYNRNGNSKIPTDPETNSEYTYQIVTDKEYKICAVFSTNTMDTTQQYSRDYAHPSGSHCMVFNGDKY